jgi:hypothetical protein
MENAVNTSNINSNDNLQTAADPQPSPALTPEQIVDQIRTIRANVGELTSLTSAQRERLRRATKVPAEAVQAQVNIIGIGGEVEASLGLSAADVRQMMDADNRWSAVEDELQSLLDGLQGANLIRRHTIVLVASQASAIGASLARNPKHVALASQLKEVRRIKKAAAHKKASPDSSPEPAPQPAAGM